MDTERTLQIKAISGHPAAFRVVMRNASSRSRSWLT